MPVIPTNSISFDITSDYPMEKVVYLESGSFTIPASTYTQYNSFPHGLPFIPLVGGGWSLTPDFSTQYNYAAGTLPATVPGTVYAQSVDIFADATNIYFVTDNTGGSSLTIYYRVFGLQPTTDDSDLEHTVSQGDPFNLNTTYTLHKVVLAGYQDLPATTGAEYSVDVAHNLGFVPMCSGWMSATTWNGTANVAAVHPIDSLRLSGNNAYLTDPGSGTVIRIANKPFCPATRVHYRAYA